MYSFERGFVPTLHSQFLVPTCATCAFLDVNSEGFNSESVTCVWGTNSLQFDLITSEKQWYPGFISEYKDKEGSGIYFAKKSNPLINELAKAYEISAPVNYFYYYPRFGFYNGFLDIFLLQDYWKVIHQLGLIHPKSLCLTEYKEKGIVLDLLLEEPVSFLVPFPQHLNTIFSFRPLLSVMFVLFSTNNCQIDSEIADYFLRKYSFNCKESICFGGDFFDNSFIEFGLILILFSLFMCDLLVVKKKFDNYRIDRYIKS